MNAEFDVAIIGAGPAGVGCALALRNSGLKVVLIDKRKFPRDKTCGDAIPGPTLRYLREILPEFTEEWELFEQKHRTRKSILFMPNGASVSINWKTKAYNSARMPFDNFLFDLVKKYTSTTIIENATVRDLTRVGETIELKVKDQESLKCKVAVGADGATSRVYKYLGDGTEQRLPQSVAVRAYYENVNFPEDANGFYLLKNFPGYFWIFPLENNLYNVGLGLLRSDMKEGFNLKKYLEQVVSADDEIGKMFKKSELKSKVLGHNLTSFNKKIAISGERYLLIGDAAHLIDPIQGHGIDKGIRSGAIAAEQIKTCFSQRDFSKEIMLNYDNSIYDELGKELVWNHKLMKVYQKMPWIVTLLQPFAKLNVEFFLKLFYRK